jgi:hypothetical protein
MPRSALINDRVQALPVVDIADVLTQLTRGESVAMAVPTP